MKKIFVRNPYNYDVNQASDESGLACLDKTRTQQHHKDECDINTIVKRFNLTGQLPVNLVMPQYGDFMGITDYHSAMTAVAQARETFDQLPARIRNRFMNDPEQFVNWATDEANIPEMIELGLATKAPEAPKTPEPTPPKGDGPGVT